MVDKRPSVMLVIDAPHFYCGVVCVSGRVVVTPPIVAYMQGWDWFRAWEYCRSKGWKMERSRA